MKTHATQARIKELLALKRDEKPPENFFVEFLREFHRRMEASGLQPGRSTPGEGAP